MYLKKQFFHAALIFLTIFAIVMVSGHESAWSGGNSEPVTSGANRRTTLDKGDPVSMATAEYHFDMEFFNLGGPFSPGFSIYYGSQAGGRLTLDGLTNNFMGSHEATINTFADRFDLELARGKRIGFTPWGADASESIPWQLLETADYYYIMNLATGIIRTLVRHDTQLGYKTYGRVNVSDSGTQADAGSMSPDISRNGRFVTFRSSSGKLVENDTNNASDIFVHDRLNGTTIRVSVASDGTEANNDSSHPSISGDGRYVAFSSFATNLDANGKYGVFVHDTQTGLTTRIAYGSDPSVSPDGRYVIFYSSSSNIVPNDTNGKDDIFVYDTTTETFTRVSVASDGTQADDYSRHGKITSNGVAVFYSRAANLVQDDNNSSLDIFVHDLTTGVTTRASIASDGVEGDANSFDPSISEDGNLIAFYSDATNLVAGDTNANKDVFVHNRQTGETSRASVASDGSQGNNFSTYCDISADGRFVAFLSYASNFVPYHLDTNNVSDIFIRDLHTGKTFKASTPYQSWLQSDGDSYTQSVSISEYGRYVAFKSEAVNLLNGDTNNQPDIFVAGRFSNSFSATAFLVREEDRNGNHINYEYPADPTMQGPDRMSDGLGREIKFTYDENHYLTRVEDQQGRSWQLTCEDSPADNPGGGWTLRSITDPMGGVTTFTYDGTDQHNIAAIKMPRGNTPYTQAYDHSGYDSGLVASQTDAYGNVTGIVKNQYDWTDPESRFTANMPDGTSEVYEHDHYYTMAKSLKDASGKSMQFQPDPDKQRLTGITDRMGDTTSVTYHPESGQMASVTDALGHTTSFTYTPQKQTVTNPVNGEQVTFTFYNLTRIDHPDGTSEVFTFDAKGNVLSRRDRGGRTWSFEYNPAGWLQKKTNPAGGIIEYTYNADGTLASRKDSDTGRVSFSYDAYLRLAQITFPDGETTQYGYDLNDRVTRVTDGNGNSIAFSYDKNGNIEKMTNPEGLEVTYGHDLLDRLVTVTDLYGKTTQYTYDAMGRYASITNPDNIQTVFGYNTVGVMDSITIGGKKWSINHDAEGVPVSIVNPLSGRTDYQTDKLGQNTVISDPQGQKTSFSHDRMGRITAMTDPLSRRISYEYDNSGRIASVTLPGAGTASYSRNDLGLLSKITDINGNYWKFSYSPTGLLKTMTDPLEKQWKVAYDDRGRAADIIFPDSSTVSYTYDNTINMVRALYSDGTDLNFNYDASGRFIATEGVSFTRDAGGRITDTSHGGIGFGAGYTDGGRLASITYNNGAFTVSYSYDNAGMLEKVSDSLTGTEIGFTHADNFMLTGISRPNGIDRTLTYDATGRLVGISDGSIIDISTTLNAAGEITREDVTAPLDPASVLSAESNTFEYDGASQAKGGGFTYDARGRLLAAPGHTFAWDGASRLVGLDGTAMSHDGLGRVIEKSASGATTDYYYNNSLGLTLLTAERDAASGSFLRYYVYTPAGRLLYMIDHFDGDKVYFYHFDRRGSTLCLTDIDGNITDSYAYSPYGTVLRHNGNSPQPFTFVGQWGVRQKDGSGRFFQMGARCYDARMARFISREPAWPAIVDPGELNPYQYALGDPLRHMDVTGLRAKKELERQIQEAQRAYWDLSDEFENAEFDLSVKLKEETQLENARWSLQWTNLRIEKADLTMKIAKVADFASMVSSLTSGKGIKGRAQNAGGFGASTAAGQVSNAAGDIASAALVSSWAGVFMLAGHVSGELAEIAKAEENEKKSDLLNLMAGLTNRIGAIRENQVNRYKDLKNRTDEAWNNLQLLKNSLKKQARERARARQVQLERWRLQREAFMKKRAIFYKLWARRAANKFFGILNGFK